MERRLAQPGFNLAKQEDWRSQDSIFFPGNMAFESKPLF